MTESNDGHVLKVPPPKKRNVRPVNFHKVCSVSYRFRFSGTPWGWRVPITIGAFHRCFGKKLDNVPLPLYHKLWFHAPTYKVYYVLSKK